MPPLGLPRLSADPVLWLPLWLGTLRDASEYENHGSPITPLHWTARSGVDGVWSGDVGYISVAHSASIGSGGRGSLVMSGQLGDQFTWKNFFRKVTGGARLQFYCSSATRIELFDGTNSSYLTADINGARSIAVTWPDTGKPSFYVNGVFAGLGSLAVTIPPTTDVLMIGGDSVTGSRAHIASALQYNEALSAPEIAELDDYLQSRITPRRQWPGSGLRYPDRETNLLVDGDMRAPTTVAWTPGNNADLSKVDDPISGRILRVAYDAVNQPNARQNTGTSGVQERAILRGRGDGTYGFQIYLGGVLILNGTPSTAWQETDMLVTPASDAVAFFSLATGPGYAEFGVNKLWTNPPGYTPRTGDPLFLDNIQTARVTLADQTSGFCSNTPAHIESGTFALSEDATGRYYDCVSAGKLRVRLLGADGFDTKLFTEEGGATLSKDTTGFDLDFGTGDIVRAVQLTAP